MARKKKTPLENEDASQKEIKKLLPNNKALALSFAVALAFASVGSTTTFAVDPKNNPKQNMVLEKEKEDKEAEREWQTDEQQGYSYYNPGYGYYYRPFMWSGGSSYSSRAARWNTASTSKSSVGGYSISKGSAAG